MCERDVGECSVACQGGVDSESNRASRFARARRTPAGRAYTHPANVSAYCDRCVVGCFLRPALKLCCIEGKRNASMMYIHTAYGLLRVFAENERLGGLARIIKRHCLGSATIISLIDIVCRVTVGKQE